MKKVLLSIISILLITALSAFAYETALIKFPPGERWVAAAYQNIGDEIILQYVLNGQSAQNWTRTLVIHSYKGSSPNFTRDPAELLGTVSYQLLYQNSSAPYNYISDTMATRCVTGNSRVPSQCEILRTTNTFSGIIFIHYINKNKEDFKKNYQQWLYIIKSIKIYQSYFRDNRVMDKDINFEL